MTTGALELVRWSAALPRAPRRWTANGRTVRTAIASALLAGAGALAAVQPFVAVGVGGAALVVALRNRAWLSTDATYRANRWIAAGWVALFLLSNVKLSASRSPLEAAGGSLTPDNMVELLGYAVVGIVAAASMYPKGRGARSLGLAWFFAWAALGVGSAAWSMIPLFSLTRALQLFVPILLAAHSIRVWREDPETGAALWRITLRLFVLSILVLTIGGFAIHQWPQGRFMWPWAQSPVLASGMAGFAFVALLAGGRRLTGWSAWSFAGALGLLGAALAVGQTRSVLAGAALALLVALWLAGRDRPAVRYVALPVLLVAAIAALLLAKNPLIEYLSRGQSASTLSTLNGRLGVWQLAIHSVSTSHRWLLGFGQGSARVLLFRQLNWAGEAHNTWLEILLGTGLVGLTVAVVAVLALGFHLFRPSTPAGGANRVAAALFVYLLVLSQADYYLAVPGFAFTALVFFSVLVMGQRQAPARAGGELRRARFVPGPAAERSPPAPADPGSVPPGDLDATAARHVEQALATIMGTAEEAAGQLVRRTRTVAERDARHAARAWRALSAELARLHAWRARSQVAVDGLHDRVAGIRDETVRAVDAVRTNLGALEAPFADLQTTLDGFGEAMERARAAVDEDIHARI